MKRKVAVVLIVPIGLCVLLFVPIKIYVAYEERARASAPGNDDRYVEWWMPKMEEELIHILSE